VLSVLVGQRRQIRNALVKASLLFQFLIRSEKNNRRFDIEGPDYWDSNQQANQDFMQGLLDEAANYFTIGIYTSESQWEPIMGDWDGGSSYPLWYAHYGKINLFLSWLVVCFFFFFDQSSPTQMAIPVSMISRLSLVGPVQQSSSTLETTLFAAAILMTIVRALCFFCSSLSHFFVFLSGYP
jgi:hypothetical protein